MKLLLALLLLLSVSFADGHRILEKLEKALKNEDRRALKPLFNASFTFETSHDHTGDADEAIDWILNNTVHGPFKSMLYAENPNNKEGLVVDVIFRGTHVHLLLTINIEAQTIFRGAFQTVGDPDGKYTEAPPETDEPPTTTTTATSTRVPKKSPQQKWYSELLKAINEKSTFRVQKLIGSKFHSTSSRGKIIHQLLIKYRETNIFDLHNAFVVSFDYAESRIQIRGYVNSKKVVEIRSIQFETPEEKWYAKLIKAIDMKNRYLVSSLIGQKFTSNSTRETIIDGLTEKYESTDLTNIVEAQDHTFFLVTFEYKNRKSIEINGTVTYGKVSITRINVKQQNSGTRGIAHTWYTELVTAIKEKNEIIISKLIGYSFESETSRREIIEKLSQEYTNSNFLPMLRTLFVRFVYADKSTIHIHANVTETRVRVTRITVSSQTTTTPISVEYTTPFQFYQELLNANKKQDSDSVSILIGNGFKSNLTKEVIVRTILKNYTSSDFKKTSRNSFIIRFDYTHHVSLELVGKYTTRRVTITEIRKFFRVEKTTTTTRPIPPAEIFVGVLISAIKTHRTDRITEVIGTTYTSTVPKTQIVHILTQTYINLYVEQPIDGGFIVYIDYEGGQSLEIVCTQTGKVKEIKVISKKPTSTTSKPPTTVTITKKFYQELIKAAEEKNEKNVWRLIGNNYTTELTKEEIIEKIFQKFTKTELRSSVHYTSFEVEFQYDDDTVLLFHGDVEKHRVVVKYIKIIRSKHIPTIEENFYELLVNAVRAHNTTGVAILIGNEYISNLSKEKVFETIVRTYRHVEFKRVSKRDFEIIFDYDDGNRLVLICTQILERITVTYINYQQNAPQPTPAPITWIQFEEEIVDASKKKNTSEIAILIGTDYECNLNPSEVVDILTTDFVNVTLRPLFTETTFSITFIYENGSKLVIYCEQIEGKIRVYGIWLFKNSQTTTTSAPISTDEYPTPPTTTPSYPTPPTTTPSYPTPPTTQCPEKELIHQYNQTEELWKSAVERNNTKLLNIYIDENFKMTFDKEGTSMGKKRFIRALIEGFHLFSSPNNVEAVREASGLIKVEGCIGEHEVRAWFAEGQKYWVLKRAFYNKNVLERKNAKKCVA